jgi:iron uptake system EfeUOB component EfeO/EfeM
MGAHMRRVALTAALAVSAGLLAACGGSAPPAKEYHVYVAAGLNTLLGQADALAADLRAGNLGAARSAWLPAHLTYERLGAAYDAFGNFDPEIDGRPDGLAEGVNSPRWTGFYRLEYGLWHGQSARELTPLAATLVAGIRALQASWPSTEINLLDIGLRTHEILENARRRHGSPAQRR